MNFGHIYECSTTSLNILRKKMANNTENHPIWPLEGYIMTSVTSERSKLQSVIFCFIGVKYRFFGSRISKATSVLNHDLLGLTYLTLMTFERSTFFIGIFCFMGVYIKIFGSRISNISSVLDYVLLEVTYLTLMTSERSNVQLCSYEPLSFL